MMIEQKYGRIINISSMNGQIAAFGQANYSASKGGIIAFTKTAALGAGEVRHHGQRRRARASPRPTCSPKVPEKIQEQIKGEIPLGRFAKPEEIAKAVVFLAADGDYITGQQINVNGGAYM